jgi:transcription elongation factor Elf1
MLCPRCESKVKVVRVVQLKGSTYREVFCPACGFKSSTEEKPIRPEVNQAAGGATVKGGNP